MLTNYFVNKFLKAISDIQSSGPYRIAGYSYGACVAVEMALQLQKYYADDSKIVESLILLDGSHKYVVAHTNTHKTKLTNRSEEESEAMCAFIQLFMAIDYNQVQLTRLISCYKSHSLK